MQDSFLGKNPQRPRGKSSDQAPIDESPCVGIRRLGGCGRGVDDDQHQVP